MTREIIVSPRSSRIAHVTLRRGFTVLLASLLTANVAVAQGSGSSTQLDEMRRQMDALRRRTDSLQKRNDSLAKALIDFINDHKREQAADDANEQVKAAQERQEARELDQRLDGIEARLAATSREGSPNKSTGAASVVRAPFVVEDGNGSVILRVTGGKSPRLMIGEEKGGGVEMGTGSAGGGVVRVRDATTADRVILIASDGFGQLRALSQMHSAVLTSSDESYGALLSLFKGDVATARMKSGLDGNGGFVLSDAAGEELVGAGGAKTNRGIVGMVRTGPKRGNAGTMGPPSFIVGSR